MGTPGPWEWGNIAEEEAQGSRGEGFGSAAQTTPHSAWQLLGAVQPRAGAAFMKSQKGLPASSITA